MSGETRLGLTPATRGLTSKQSSRRGASLVSNPEAIWARSAGSSRALLSADDGLPRRVPRLRGDLRESRSVDTGQGPT